MSRAQQPTNTHNTQTHTCTHSLEKGTTYNSYLIFGTASTALVDTSHEKFSKLFIKVCIT